MQFVLAATLTVPPGTSAAAPTVLPWPLRDGRLDNLQIRIPRGHVGLTGVRVLMSGTQIVPFDSTDYLIGDGDLLDYPLDYDVNADTVTVEGFNVGQLTHSFYLRALLTPAGTFAGPAPEPLPLDVPPVLIQPDIPLPDDVLSA